MSLQSQHFSMMTVFFFEYHQGSEEKETQNMVSSAESVAIAAQRHSSLGGKTTPVMTIGVV